MPEHPLEGIEQVDGRPLILSPRRILGFASGLRGHLVLVREVARHAVTIVTTALSVR